MRSSFRPYSPCSRKPHIQEGRASLSTGCRTRLSTFQIAKTSANVAIPVIIVRVILLLEGMTWRQPGDKPQIPPNDDSKMIAKAI